MIADSLGILKSGYKTKKLPQTRPRIVFVFLLILWLIVITRLFTLQVWQHSFYEGLAAGTHEIFQEILPRRGSIYIKDGENSFPIAMNKILYQVYADTRKLDDPEDAAVKIAPLAGMDSDEQFKLFLKLKDGKERDDPFEPIKQKISEKEKLSIEALEIEGIGFIEQPFRLYPEDESGAAVVGFYGLNSEGKPVGRYGVEGFFNNQLSGKPGFIQGEKDAIGAWIPLGKRALEAAHDGSDIYLTLDRTLQFELCSIVEAHAKEFNASGAAAIIVEPKTGAVKAMCSYPSFNPNVYNEVEDIDVYNNKSLFGAYEPGSVFKPITMAAALDQEVVTPDTTYIDEGSRKFGKYTIRNALNKKYGMQTMTNVLEQSINTGMIFIVEKLGKEMFREYVHRFGFGSPTGLQLDTEVAGDVSSLDKEGEIFAATASFGQGITATPMQIVAAYSAIANRGEMPKIHIVDEIQHKDGKVNKTDITKTHRVLSDRAASLLVGMMVSSVENGHMTAARVPGFYIAGKTGTAQIAEGGDYSENATNHTFAGFGPAEDPRFVIVVKYERPERNFADATAVPTFGKMAKFLLQYYGIAPTR
jgi:cell division protein FtsI (penicillin-binding protein 3)